MNHLGTSSEHDDLSHLELLWDCINKLLQVDASRVMHFKHLVYTCSRQWGPYLRRRFDRFLDEVKAPHLDAAMRGGQYQRQFNEQYRVALLRFCRSAVKEAHKKIEQDLDASIQAYKAAKAVEADLALAA